MLLHRITPDYIKERRASNSLAAKIEEFWHLKGYTSVKAWVETAVGADGQKFHYVRSNIVMKVPVIGGME